jgi:quinohemoprotein amine dehydrogenase
MNRQIAKALFLLLLTSLFCLVLFAQGGGQSPPQQAVGRNVEEGIPVSDPLVISKCSGCHQKDDKGNLSRISWDRTTPEGWQEVIRRMVRLNGLTLTPEEGRAIVKSLSSSHGLAPEEAKPVMYMAEHRLVDETYPTPTIRSTCASCHPLGRPMSWRRSREEWQLLVNMHIGFFPNAEGLNFRRPNRGADPTAAATQPQQQPADEAVDYFGKNFGLRTPQWAAWSARMRPPRLAGKWLLTAHRSGHGNYVGEAVITAGAAEDEFTTRITLRPVSGGPAIERTGRVLVYAGYSWRGRSMGTAPSSAPGEVPSEMYETMWISPDEPVATGRWFWGGYDEFSFDVRLQRASGTPMLSAVDRPSLQAGLQTQRIRLLGDSLPAQIAPSDLTFGSGVTVRRIVSRTPQDVVAEVDVAANAIPGRRDIALGSSILPNAIAVYDKVDYIKVIPETGVSRLGGASQHPKGYQQFEVMAYNRGIDNKVSTADDIEIGPVSVAWSVEEFPERFDDDDKRFVGALDANGLFTPAPDGPNPERKQSANNYGNVWVVATAQNEKDRYGKPLVGKSYLVVVPPLFIIWDREMAP